MLNKLLNKNTSILYIANNEKTALELYNFSKFFISNNVQVIYLPACDSNPYTINSCSNFLHRASSLHKLSKSINNSRLIISSVAGLTQFQPPIATIKEISKILQIKEPAPNSYNQNIDFIKPSNPKYSI